jgi:hypothetical protein
MSTAPFPKPLLTELVSLIDTVLNSINPSAAVYLNRNTVDAAYAGYVFSLLLAAAEQVADTNTFRLRSTLAAQQQTSPNVFIIRGSPGPLNSTTQDFGFASFRYRGVAHEIHLGVQYRGSSGVLHEFDVSILPADAADQCRSTNKAPGSAKACALFECKCYTKILGIELGREFVGLKTDFTSIPMARLVTNADSDSVALFLKKTNRPKLSVRLAPNNLEMEQEFVFAVADELRNSL